MRLDEKRKMLIQVQENAKTETLAAIRRGETVGGRILVPDDYNRYNPDTCHLRIWKGYSFRKPSYIKYLVGGRERYTVFTACCQESYFPVSSASVTVNSLKLRCSFGLMVCES